MSVGGRAETEGLTWSLYTSGPQCQPVKLLENKQKFIIIHTGWAISRAPKNYVICDVKRCKINGEKHFPLSMAITYGYFVKYNETWFVSKY